MTGSYNNNFFTCDVLGDGIRAMKALKPGQADPSQGSIIDPSRELLDSSQKYVPLKIHPMSPRFICACINILIGLSMPLGTRART